MSIRYSDRLAEAGIDPSVGSVGDSYDDNALAETVIGLFKTEVIRQRGPWRSIESVELATLEWVSWYNTTRLFGAIGHVPPIEFEERYYCTQPDLAAAAGLTRGGSRRYLVLDIASTMSVNSATRPRMSTSEGTA